MDPSEPSHGPTLLKTVATSDIASVSPVAAPEDTGELMAMCPNATGRARAFCEFADPLIEAWAEGEGIGEGPLYEAMLEVALEVMVHCSTQGADDPEAFASLAERLVHAVSKHGDARALGLALQLLEQAAPSGDGGEAWMLGPVGRLLMCQQESAQTLLDEVVVWFYGQDHASDSSARLRTIHDRIRSLLASGAPIGRRPLLWALLLRAPAAHLADHLERKVALMMDEEVTAEDALWPVMLEDFLQALLDEHLRIARHHGRRVRDLGARLLEQVNQSIPLDDQSLRAFLDSLAVVSRKLGARVDLAAVDTSLRDGSRAASTLSLVAIGLRQRDAAIAKDLIEGAAIAA